MNSLRPSEIIEKYGWGQGDFCKTNGDRPNKDSWMDEDATCFCVLGAIFRAFGYKTKSSDDPSDVESESEVEKFRNILYNQLGDSNLIAWNDQYGRTKEEVVAALQKAEAEFFGDQPCLTSQ